ncbi:MAG: ABC transporter transmembrane domain-containing protein, partial [Ktedonobacterales bacterium]
MMRGAMGGGGGGRYGRMVRADAMMEQPARKADARTVRRVAGAFKPYKGQVAIVLLAIVVVGVLGIVNPYMLKLIISRAIPHQDFGLLAVLVGIMFITPILSSLIGVGQTYLNTQIGQRVMRDLRNNLYGHLQRMPLKFFTDTRTGEIQSRLSNDVGGVQTVVTDTASSIVSNVTIAISTIAGMLFLSWQLTLLSLGLLPVFIWLTHRVGKVRRELSKNTQVSLADLSAMVEETLSVSGMLLTKTFGRQRQQIDRFEKENEHLVGLQIRQQMIGRWFFSFISTFFSITPALVYLLAGFLAFGPGHHSDPQSTADMVGTLVAFTTLQSRLFFPIGQLLNVQVEIQGALALFDRIFEYLEMKPEITDAPDAVELDPKDVRGAVRFRDVSFSY